MSKTFSLRLQVYMLLPLLLLLPLLIWGEQVSERARKHTYRCMLYVSVTFQTYTTHSKQFNPHDHIRAANYQSKFFCCGIFLLEFSPPSCSPATSYVRLFVFFFPYLFTLSVSLLRFFGGGGSFLSSCSVMLFGPWCVCLCLCLYMCFNTTSYFIGVYLKYTHIQQTLNINIPFPFA